MRNRIERISGDYGLYAVRAAICGNHKLTVSPRECIGSCEAKLAIIAIYLKCLIDSIIA